MIRNRQTVEEFAVWVADQFSKADLYYGHGSQNVEDEAYWLASYVARFSHEDFEHGWQRPLLSSQQTEGRALVKQRIDTKKPLAYLINQIWFAGHRFYIDQRALVPRSHLGEWIPERFEPWIDSQVIGNILDLCCGGGSIGIACALYFDKAKVDLADLSESALSVARRNIDEFDLQDRVKIIHSDLFENIHGQYDLIVCNPPYVSHKNMENLPTEYSYEPQMALTAGKDGLECIRLILNQVDRYLSGTGVLILEAGTAAPVLERELNTIALNWMMSASGESVVLIMTRQELIENKEKINAMIG